MMSRMLKALEYRKDAESRECGIGRWDSLPLNMEPFPMNGGRPNFRVHRSQVAYPKPSLPSTPRYATYSRSQKREASRSSPDQPRTERRPDLQQLGKSSRSRWPSSAARNGVEQLRRRDVQRGGESDDHVERRTVFSALEHAVILLTQTGRFGEALLRQTPSRRWRRTAAPKKLVFTSSCFAS
jgi:hypothetical protein